MRFDLSFNKSANKIVIDKHFPRINKLDLMFNRKTVKKSYTWVKNVRQIKKYRNHISREQ